MENSNNKRKMRKVKEDFNCSIQQSIWWREYWNCRIRNCVRMTYKRHEPKMEMEEIFSSEEAEYKNEHAHKKME